MCMISLPVEKVSKTNIFIGLNSDKSRQITIYSNYVSNYSDANAMVIPVPSPQTVKFHDISHMKNFFVNVDKSFIRQARTLSTFTNYARSFGSDKSAKLEVLNVGSYRVSLVPSLADLTRLDKDVFVLSEGLAEKLSSYYKENYWGFIVFVLAKDSKEYHPFAYSHDIIHSNIYIPTRHYHDHMSGHGYQERIGGLDTRADPYGGSDKRLNSMFDFKNFDKNQTPKFDPRFGLAGKKWEADIESLGFGSKKSSGSQNDSVVDDWSHNIYLFNCGNAGSSSKLIQSMLNPDYIYTWDKNLYWNRRLIDFDLMECDGFEKFHIEGTHPNQDIIISI